MRYRPLGQSGIEASVIGLGTWAIGGWMWGGTEERDSVQAIHAALDQGITLIDTAPAYGFGLSEEILGKALADRRDDVVLATKCGLRWDTQKGEFKMHDPHHNKDIHQYLGPESIREEIEASLQRLNTDHIDLYQTHWQDATTPIEDTMACLMKLKDEGKIRAIGVSNASVEQIEQYRAVGPVDTDQEKYSMIDRGMEREQLPYCEKHNIAALAYSPMAMGLLTGKVGPQREFPEDDVRSRNPRFGVENRKRIDRMLDAIKWIADAHHITLAQFAVAWALAQPGLTHALVGARNEEQARENAAPGEVQFTEGELKSIEHALGRFGPDIQ